MNNIEITDEYRFNRDFSGGKYVKTVYVGIEGYPYREGEEKLPRQMAWCNKCAQESAKVVAPIWLNCKPGYALKCQKCGGEHHMYVSMYRERYIGSSLANNGGQVNPTKGIMSYRQAMDRKAVETINNIPKKVENDMCKMFNMSHEEYKEMKKGWEEENKKTRKRIANEDADRRVQWKNEEIKAVSNKRKELIAKGILKYKKGIGLVNSETGEVIKL